MIPIQASRLTAATMAHSPQPKAQSPLAPHKMPTPTGPRVMPMSPKPPINPVATALVSSSNNSGKMQ